jgi:hypothetical protein
MLTDPHDRQRKSRALRIFVYKQTHEATSLLYNYTGVLNNWQLVVCLQPRAICPSRTVEKALKEGVYGKLKRVGNR